MAPEMDFNQFQVSKADVISIEILGPGPGPYNEIMWSH